MDVSMVICTRNRGDSVVRTTQSIYADLEDHHEIEWEVIVIDQSTSDETRRALEYCGLLLDSHLVYALSKSSGLSRARNEAIRLASGRIVAFTDDDCTVSRGWGATLLRQYSAIPDLAVLYGQVTAPPDVTDGWIPVYYPLHEGGPST